ncbi:MAG: hypothetical protein WBC94_13615 [Xanthobacteraceae bacterium]
MIVENGRRMGCSWQSPQSEQAAAAAVPEAIDLATALREGKDRRRGAGSSADAAAGHNVSAGSGLEINPAVRLFSSGIPIILNSTHSAGEHLDR